MTLYVSNLGFHVTNDDLRKIFESFGVVLSASMMMAHISNSSFRFGFVKMNAEKDGRRAIKELNGKELKGKIVTVCEAMLRAYTYDKIIE